MKLRNKLFTLATLLFLFFVPIANISAEVIKLPYSYAEEWNTNAQGTDALGVHRDSFGYAIDLYTDGYKGRILAPISGTLERGCTAGQSTYLSLTNNQGMIIRLLHIDTTTVSITKGQSIKVNQGDYLGDLNEAGTYTTSNCMLLNEKKHVHISWEADQCPITIDGYTFECGGMVECRGSYIIDCNKKYLNQIFLSTNGFDTSNSNCNQYLNKSYVIGQSGDEVTSLQVCLKSKGLYNWSNGYTGYYGNYTNTALSNYNNNKSNVNSCDYAYSRSYTIGQAGDEVTLLQECLKADGLYKWQYGVTGYYGPYTDGLMSSFNSVILDDCGTLYQLSWSVGQEGSSVVKLQDCLTNQGLYDWPYGSTGYYGEYTQSVMTKVRVGDNCGELITRNWVIGQVGDDVRALQTCLQGAGIYQWHYGVTGYYGAYTDSLI